MRLSDLALCIGARVLTNEGRAAGIDIDHVFAANKMSDLLDRATGSTLLVSSLSTPHLVRVADLLDVPCICLANGATPSDGFVQAAQDGGKVLLCSTQELAEICRRLTEQGLACTSRA
jgi:hypothetical protein